MKRKRNEKEKEKEKEKYKLPRIHQQKKKDYSQDWNNEDQEHHKKSLISLYNQSLDSLISPF